jgi:hypothetical protein
VSERHFTACKLSNQIEIAVTSTWLFREPSGFDFGDATVPNRLEMERSGDDRHMRVHSGQNLPDARLLELLLSAGTMLLNIHANS